MKSLAEPWWLHCSAVLRYMPELDRKTIGEIAAELPGIAAAGYQVVQITAPYSSAGLWPWWGLRPRDYFTVNEALCGDMADFAALVAECHRLGP